MASTVRRFCRRRIASRHRRSDRRRPPRWVRSSWAPASVPMRLACSTWRWARPGSARRARALRSGSGRRPRQFTLTCCLRSVVDHGQPMTVRHLTLELAARSVPRRRSRAGDEQDRVRRPQCRFSRRWWVREWPHGGVRSWPTWPPAVFAFAWSPSRGRTNLGGPRAAELASTIGSTAFDRRVWSICGCQRARTLMSMMCAGLVAVGLPQDSMPHPAGYPDALAGAGCGSAQLDGTATAQTAALRARAGDRFLQQVRRPDGLRRHIPETAVDRRLLRQGMER